MFQQLEREVSGNPFVSPDCRVVTTEPFRVVHLSARFLPESIRSRLGLRESDFFVEVHFPNIVEAPANAPTREHKTGSFRTLFEWIAQSSSSFFPAPVAVEGITHRWMAGGARILGFETIEIDESELDPVRLKKIREGYQKTGRFRRGFPMGGIFACHFPFERFMARFNHSQ